MSQTTRVTLYALSTCPYCRRTREFMDSKGISYHLIDVDLLEGNERDEVVRTVTELNPRLSFPTIVIGEGDRKHVYVGLDNAAEHALLELI
ncbi:glutaredoxin [Desulfovibrio sp. OttesenSCG-928-C06]|nr:glutaredoxin [Desulfovibrio sp. OttesenSCG-928-C06]